MSKPERLANRPAELEDWLNRTIYHPLARRLALALQSTPITPNAVSVTGGAMVVAAAAVYLGVAGHWGGILGLSLMIGWHVLDGADGDLARLTGRASRFGEIIDGACDYVGHAILYVALAAVLAAQIGPIGWLLMAATALARMVQTVFYETQRRQYQSWIYETPWLRLSRENAALSVAINRGALGWIAGFYLKLSNVLATGGAQVDDKLSALSQADRGTMRPFIKTQMLPVMSYISSLSSNYRTLVIGATMIAGYPIAIVVFELCFLTLVFLSAFRRSDRAIKAVLAYSPANNER